MHVLAGKSKALVDRSGRASYSSGMGKAGAQTLEQASWKRSRGIEGVELLCASFVNQNFSKHFHDCYALGIIESGALRFNYLGVGHVAPAGSVNLVVPGKVHDGHGADESGWSYRMLYIDPGRLGATMGELGGKCEHLPFFRSGVLDDPELARGVRRLHRCLSDETTPLMERQTRLRGVLAAWVARHAVDRPGWPGLGRETGPVSRARQIIEDRFADDLSLDELAREAGLSPFHLARTFSAHMGVPPHAYLIQTRINRAKDMLHTAIPLSVVALDTGFADQSHLTRTFKRQMGVTPGVYRKMLQDR